MIKWISICLTIVFNFEFGTLKGQTIEHTLEAGTRAYHNGDYQVAQELFERAFYFKKDEIDVADYDLLFKSYLRQEKYGEAHNTLVRARAEYKLSDSIQNELILSHARLSFHQDNLEEMKYWLFQVDTFFNENQEQRLNGHLGLCFFLLGEFDESEIYFSKSFDFSKNEQSESFTKIYSKAKRIERLRPNLAYLSSIFIPGLGQLYAGFPGEALNSVVLNGALGLVYINTLFTYGFFEAFILVYPWFVRYYNGGYKRAKSLALLKKETTKYELSIELIDLINYY